jgi:tRNA 2-selenouridine synthase
MTWRELAVEKLNDLKNPLVIDVRSPGEHESERIPDSVNVPLLSNDERAQVGTAYVQEGEFVARRMALKIIAPKLPELIESIIGRKQQGQAIVVHCWRGGLRSEAIASFLSIVGIDCWRLTGGYKAWRNLVIKELNNNCYQFTPVILHGYTGVGKTELLQKLERFGHAVLDLEQLANHRGSSFGGTGLGKQPTQKNFEAYLWQKLRAKGTVHLLMEAESRKIGKLSLPDFLLAAIDTGKKILVTGSIKTRTKRIVSDYAGILDDSVRAELTNALWNLKEFLGKNKTQELIDLLNKDDLTSVVKTLLTEYYDPHYGKHMRRYEPFDLTVDSDQMLEAVKQINDWLKTQTIGA